MILIKENYDIFLLKNDDLYQVGAPADTYDRLRDREDGAILLTFG